MILEKALMTTIQEILRKLKTRSGNNSFQADVEVSPSDAAASVILFEQCLKAMPEIYVPSHQY